MPPEPAVSGQETLAYRPAIDGLRALAVLSVLLFHLDAAWLPGGFVGVDVFFVISGFLITSLIHEDCERGRFSLARFYQRRAARLFPAFFTVAVPTLALAWWTYVPQDVVTSGESLVAASLSVANIRFMLQGHYFQAQTDAQPYLHYWSLSVEEQFYLLFPTVFLYLRLRARRAQAGVLAGLGLLSLAACLVTTRLDPARAFYELPQRVWELLAGCVLALRVHAGAQRPRPAWWNGLAALGLLMVLAAFFVIEEGPLFPGPAALLPVLGTLLVLGPHRAPGGPVEAWLARGPLVYVGRLSYSLYLWHWPVIAFVGYNLPEWPKAARLALEVLLSLLLAAACFHLVEAPARRRLCRPELRRATFLALAGTVLLAVVLGLVARERHQFSAALEAMPRGGIVRGGARAGGTIALLGDSQAVSYGPLLHELAAQLDRRLLVLSANAEDPFPADGTRADGRLWDGALVALQRERPGVVVVACDWATRAGSPERLRSALRELSRHSRRIVLLTSPPRQTCGRGAIRAGARPPCLEPEAVRRARRAASAAVLALRSETVRVIDVEPGLTDEQGGVRVLDPAGRRLYHDGSHLSPAGTRLFAAELRQALAAP